MGKDIQRQTYLVQLVDMQHMMMSQNKVMLGAVTRNLLT